MGEAAPGQAQDNRTSARSRARAVRNLSTIGLLRPPDTSHGGIEEAAARAPTVAAFAAAAAADGDGDNGAAASTRPSLLLLPDLRWHTLPPAADPCYVLSAEAAAGPRGRKKRAQVANFAAVLQVFISAAASSPPPRRRPLRVVDIGCGSGAVVLALAALFPPEQAVFVGVDMKIEAIDRLRQRAAEAGLAHVRGVVAMAESFCWTCDDRGEGIADADNQQSDHTFDVALALHACGNATDCALELAARCGAAYAVSPCCLGKLSFSVEGGSSFHPRLRTLTSTRRGERAAARRDANGGSAALAKLEDAIAAQDVAEQQAAEERRRRGCPHVERVQVRHPRSAWLKELLERVSSSSSAVAVGGGIDEAFKALARAADGVNHGECCSCCSNGDGDDHDEDAIGALELRAARAAKAVVEMDRSAAMRETAGYATALLRLSPIGNEAAEDAAPGARDDLLIGVPSDGHGGRWQGVRDAIAKVEAR